VFDELHPHKDIERTWNDDIEGVGLCFNLERWAFALDPLDEASEYCAKSIGASGRGMRMLPIELQMSSVSVAAFHRLLLQPGMTPSF
jgi:hypothetical protein